MRSFVWDGEITAQRVRELVPRAAVSIDSVAPSVQKLIAEVQAEGAAALARHAQEFDGVVPNSFRVPISAIKASETDLPDGLRDAITESIDRVRKVSQATLPRAVSLEVSAGGAVETRFVPVDSVGLYVPGGKAVYPSSTVMNVVPAQVAGVPRIAVSSPAQKDNDGLPSNSVLATCSLLGIDEVYSIGGASAIAALALGVVEIGMEPVRMVTGPGNIYVAAAKRQLRSQIAIDSEAGPTEILIIADESADPKFVAADLISQAEHDENAASVLLTNSQSLIDGVLAELERQGSKTANSDRVAIALGGNQSALVLVESIDQAIEIANEYATEHLEIQTADPVEVSKRITNAGAIFLGNHTPVSLGDYLAGSNHVLPTGEQAKFASGLSVMSFLRSQQVVNYSEAALKEVASKLEVFAEAEGLPAHSEAVQIRFED
ncbi:MAG: histidinol dehydrogenase [Actinobacteria bacterium]|nr:histidinol dehydrogenase [Actinomycetota bacterium]